MKTCKDFDIGLCMYCDNIGSYTYPDGKNCWMENFKNSCLKFKSPKDVKDFIFKDIPLDYAVSHFLLALKLYCPEEYLEQANIIYMLK